MNEKQWRDELVTKGAAFKAVEDKMKNLLKYFGYDNYEQADEKTQLAYDGMMDALTAIYDTPPTAQPEITHCGDCKYKDDGIDEDGIPFLKCLNGRSYGGTRINDYCSWAERRQMNGQTD